MTNAGTQARKGRATAAKADCPIPVRAFDAVAYAAALEVLG